MDISETWKKLEKEKLETPIDSDFKKDQSNHPVSKLKKNYYLKSIMMIVFVIIFGSIAITADQTSVRILFGVLTIAYTIFMVSSYSMYKNISIDGPVIDVLNRVTRALRFERISSLMIYPLAGVAGYLGGYSITGKSVNNIFATSTQVGILIGAIMICTIVGYLLGRFLEREGYGKSLDEIQRMITQLKS